MVQIAERISRLGTETAFAVSGEANAFAARGNRIYPFHLGDLNLATPSTVVDGSIDALKAGKTGYCPNAGIPPLREALAEDINASRGTAYTAENVIVQPGGKPTIGKLVLALVNPGDEVLYPNPGYPIYESQVEFNGGVARPYTFTEGDANFALDMKGLEASLTDKTKILIVNDLQNPTGAECSDGELEQLARIAVERDLVVLADEAYFDIRYEGKSRSLASLPGMAERTVILYTFSKKFAMTGWRLGAAVAPKPIADVIAKLNVNDESCSNHFIQYGAVEGLKGDQAEVLELLSVLKERRDVAVDILNSIDGVQCFRPNATFYLYPNVTQAMKSKGFASYEELRKAALHETGVSFCTRLHFGRELPGETSRYIRLAYSGIDLPDIKEGLGKLKAFLEG